jgi:hypothetical protein
MLEHQAITDLVVLIPGILGSNPGPHGSLVWPPSAGALRRRGS